MKDLGRGDFYHVCTEGLEQAVLLRDDEDFRVAWNYLALSAWRCGVEVVAFTIMSNHVHQLLLSLERDMVRKTVRLYKQLLSAYLQNKYGISKIMHRSDDSITLIDSIQYLRNCIAYIYRNPVSAKICARPEAYKWTSYHSCFKTTVADAHVQRVCELNTTMVRRLFRTGISLSKCKYEVNSEGYLTLDSFVRNDIVSKLFWHSGKSFLYHMGACNDTKMEYELVYQPLMNVTDMDMQDAIAKYVAKRYGSKSISELTTSEKCSILRSIFFNFRTTVPQLSRILGLPRELVRRMLAQ